MSNESNLHAVLPRVLSRDPEPVDLALARDLIASCEEEHILQRLAGAEAGVLREAAIQRLLQLQPDQVEHHLLLHQHLLSVHRHEDAALALDAAERLAPRELRIMRARLALHARDEPAALLALAKSYLPRYGSDPILGMVIVRCEKALERAAQAAPTEPQVELPRAPELDAEPWESAQGDDWLRPQRPDPARIQRVLGNAPQREPDPRRRRQQPPRQRIVLPVVGPEQADADL